MSEDRETCDRRRSATAPDRGTDRSAIHVRLRQAKQPAPRPLPERVLRDRTGQRPQGAVLQLDQSSIPSSPISRGSAFALTSTAIIQARARLPMVFFVFAQG